MVETAEARDRINIAAYGIENESRLMAVIAESLGGGCDEYGAVCVACEHLLSICEDLRSLSEKMK